MRLEQMTVHLRVRSAWEAMELGMALVRRDAGVIWKSWFALTLPLFLLLNVAAWAVGHLWLAWPVLLWLKPVLARVPLFVISRSVFGPTPGVAETLRAQFRWGWGPMPGYLSWRRFGPARSLLMPIELLEGGSGSRLRERRRVLAGAAYAHASLLTGVMALFQTMLAVACVFLVLMFVQPEQLPETLRAGWALIGEQTPWWVMLAWNLFVWAGVSVIEPFYVGAGFGLYLNRRTELEAWDVEIAFRKLRARLLAAAAPSVLVLGLLGTALPSLSAQERAVPPATRPAQQAAAPTPATLPTVFGQSRVDERDFAKAAERAYEDPLLNAKRTLVTWEKRDKPKPVPERDLSWLSWLSSIGTVFAFLAEWGLWILVALLVGALLLSARHWLPWMRGSFGGKRSTLPEAVETEALPLPETLPDDVPAAARRLWAQGKPRHALALLYRASVETMAGRAGVALPPGATESECLRASRRMPDSEDRSLFARMVRVWQYAAYGHRLPAAEEFEELLGQLQQRYRWSA